MTFLSHLFGHRAAREEDVVPPEPGPRAEEPREDREQEMHAHSDPEPRVEREHEHHRHPDPAPHQHPDPEPRIERPPDQHQLPDHGQSAEREYPHRPAEFEYLAALLVWRIRRSFGSGGAHRDPKPVMPEFARWQLKIQPFIDRNGFGLPTAERSSLTVSEATLLLLASAPHIQPDLLDGALQSAMRQAGEFPQLGGIRPDGHNFRGFLPTGETALFLLGDDDYHERVEVRRLFDADHFFNRKKILWLEQLPPGEPALSGKIIVSQDYIESFVTGKPASPHFGANFPAKKIEERRTRERSLVLNAELIRQVDDIKSWVDNNDTLLYRYGMEDRLKKGYRALFYGPPGTGKTFTAGILGNELKKPVYKIDISMVVSKYIGETEKNLELLFARAEDKGWILFFDEADALFGKRTDVRDAHDKYANQEVSYLLQRIEDYDGLIILATNKKNNIDEAFVRRFNAILRFPFPDHRDREEIWKKSLAENARFVREIKGTGNDDDLPEALETTKVLRFLKRYELSGANIMNVVHHASLKAIQRAEAASPDNDQPLTIYLGDLLAEIRKELGKENRPFVEIKGTEHLKMEPRQEEAAIHDQ